MLFISGLHLISFLDYNEGEEAGVRHSGEDARVRHQDPTEWTPE